MLLLLPGTSVAETFDLAIFRYCAPGTLCGYDNEALYRASVCAAVDELNAEWQEVGYSFRPTIFAINSVSPPEAPAGAPADKQKYYQTAGCKDDGDDLRLRVHWRENVALKAPTAISMMLTQGPNSCCSNIARPSKPEEELYGIYCDAASDRAPVAIGSIWGHEMGHHWGLVHTFGGQDTIDALPLPPKNDGDASDSDLSGPVLDTPADRLRFESYAEDDNGDPKPGKDEDKDGNILNFHEWCVTSVQDLPVAWKNHATYCDINCMRKTPDGVVTLGDPTPYPWAAMSYYGSQCRGPYWLAGDDHQPFTADSIDRIQAAREQVVPRQNLIDVCATQGLDSDHDGICGFQDRCPGIADSCELDSDDDGIPDSCDLCPTKAGPNDDLDGDGIGDICDPDLDNDGCSNRIDQHPTDANPKTGVLVAVNCPENQYEITTFEGIDSDNDGLLNCRDPDDDNDGIADDDDPCPLVPGGGQLACMDHTSCPFQNWWDVCMLAGCNELLGVLTSLVNPDPTREIVFELVDIVDTSIYFQPLTGSAIEAVAAIERLAVATAGQVAGVAAAKAAATEPAALRLEIRRRGSDEIVATVGTFDPGDVVFDREFAGRGRYLVFQPTERGARALLRVTGAYRRGVLTAAEPDRDRDGAPDIADNCLAVANPRQRDSDADGTGNACDFDLDNDGRVSRRDLATVRACVGINLGLEVPFWEPSLEGEPANEPSPSPETIDLDAIRRSRQCRAADFDGDGTVGRRDIARVRAMVGKPPRSSGR